MNLNSNNHKFFRIDFEFISNCLMIFTFIYIFWTIMYIIHDKNTQKRKKKPIVEEKKKRISFSLHPTVYEIDSFSPIIDKIDNLFENTANNTNVAMLKRLQKKLEFYEFDDPHDHDNLEYRFALMNLLLLRANVFLQLQYTFKHDNNNYNNNTPNTSAVSSVDGGENIVKLPSSMSEDELDYNLERRGIDFSTIKTEKIIKIVSFDYCLRNELASLKELIQLDRNPHQIHHLIIDDASIIELELKQALVAVLKLELEYRNLVYNNNKNEKSSVRELFNFLLTKSDTLLFDLKLLRAKKML